MLRELTSAQVADWMAFYSLEQAPSVTPDVEARLRKAFGGPAR